jgi:hypothetical protein
MRVIPFVYCVLVTVVLMGLYICRHNQLTEWRIRALSLEKEMRSEEAEQRRFELQLALFMSPIRLEEIGRNAQYAHLHQPTVDAFVEE